MLVCFVLSLLVHVMGWSFLFNAPLMVIVIFQRKMSLIALFNCLMTCALIDMLTASATNEEIAIKFLCIGAVLFGARNLSKLTRTSLGLELVVIQGGYYAGTIGTLATGHRFSVLTLLLVVLAVCLLLGGVSVWRLGDFSNNE